MRVQKRRVTLVGACVFSLAIVASAVVGEVNLLKLSNAVPSLIDFVARIAPEISISTFGEDIASWMWSFNYWIVLIADTVVMAFLGTFIGVVLAFSTCFYSSRNLVSSTLVYVISRRVQELARTVPELVYALIFVIAFGVGPLAGVLAIGIHTWGALGKLFSEVNENIDTGVLDGIRSAGGAWSEIIRLGVVPQVLPNYVSYTLLRFEINVRSASVLGLVGAGGIGQELYLVIRQFEYPDISAILLLIVLTVVLIDIVSERVRHRLIGRFSLAGA